MKNLYLCFLLLSFAGVTLQAQNVLSEKGQQLVYFEDGSIVKGVILEYKLGEKLVMRVAGQEVSLPAQGVLYITRGRESREVEKQLEEGRDARKYAFPERGLYNVTGISLNIGEDYEGTTAGLGIQHVVGYQINRWVGLGVGGSLDLYAFNEEKPFISVFGDVRGYLTPTRIAPFYAFQMGYGFLNDKRIRDSEGGLLLYPAVGVRLGGRAGANLSLDMGYKYQRSRWEHGWWDGFTVVNYRYHRYVFRASLTF